MDSAEKSKTLVIAAGNNGVMNTTEKTMPGVWPTLKARDAEAMLAFLTTVLGFEESAVYRDGDYIAHAELLWPEGGGLMFGSHRPGTVWDRDPGTAGTYIATDHVDDVYQRVSQAGGIIVAEPEATGYGSYEFTCADPDGNLWSFGTYRGHTGDS